MYRVIAVSLDKPRTIFTVTFLPNPCIFSSMRYDRDTKRLCYNVIDEIIHDICHLPQGYGFWFHLPKTGNKSQKAVREYWVKVIHGVLFPETFKVALLSAILTIDGIPKPDTKHLYRWAVETLYNGNEKRLYKDWIQLVKGA